jgi:hypothetical protein
MECSKVLKDKIMARWNAPNMADIKDLASDHEVEIEM